MTIPDWVAHNWFSVLQTGTLSVALFLIGFAIFLEARARRVANLIQLSQQHRELWERLYVQPDLERILDPSPNLENQPLTAQEELFVIFIILHLANTYSAMRSGFFPKPRGLRRDIELFFSLPIPKIVWNKVKELHEVAFTKFVEHSLSTSFVETAS